MNNVFIRSVKWLIPTILCGLTLLGCGGSSAPSVSSSAPSVSSTIVGQVSTLAGSGTEGRANGSGTGASFGLMTGVAVDSSGNLYVADTSNFLIRKITPAGFVTTFAGTGSAGSADGTGTAASFKVPVGVAVDSSGNVYVIDAGTLSIRKITPAGVVTTFAGSGLSGVADGTGTAASFHTPMGIAVDSSGNLYVPEMVKSLIRKITPAGVVTTLAGSFSIPTGVAVDSSGNLYVTDRVNNSIVKMTPAGIITTLAGGSIGATNGTGTAASFNGPGGIAVDSSDNVFVVDTENHLIRKITPAGVVTTLAGSRPAGSTNGIGTAASFSSPHSIAADSSGNLYVTDKDNFLVRKITYR